MTAWDRGLQPERTELAWRRTALSAGLLSLVSARLLPAVLGHPAWALVGVVGMLGAGAVWLASRRRSRTVVTALLDGAHGLPVGAGLLLSTAVGFALIGVGGVLVLIHTIR